jgi:hypothetical protein
MPGRDERLVNVYVLVQIEERNVDRSHWACAVQVQGGDAGTTQTNAPSRYASRGDDPVATASRRQCDIEVKMNGCWRQRVKCSPQGDGTRTEEGRGAESKGAVLSRQLCSDECRAAPAITLSQKR